MSLLFGNAIHGQLLVRLGGESAHIGGQMTDRVFRGDRKCGLDKIVLEIRRQQAESRSNAGVGGNDHGGNLQDGGYIERRHRSRSSKGHQREMPWIYAFLDGSRAY